MYYVFAVSNALTIQGHNILDSRPVYRTLGPICHCYTPNVSCDHDLFCGLRQRSIISFIHIKLPIYNHF